MPAEVELVLGDSGNATLQFRGVWAIRGRPPTADETMRELDQRSGIRTLGFAVDDLGGWDSALVTFLVRIIATCSANEIEVDQSALPDGVRGLLKLAYAVPERTGARRVEKSEPFLVHLGKDFIDLVQSTGEVVAFLGLSVLSFRRFLTGKARYRKSDLWLIMQQAGADALPIISLVTFLVGMILAFIGIQQLARFGAKIYVADLVGLATVMQIGALITAIVLAGRTGAAFAAQIGTMQVNEEIDALKTLAIDPMDFLVLPRMLALMLMTPLLCVYADLMGILGGALVGTLVGDTTLLQYFQQTRAAIGLNHVAQGLINAVVYGAIVAVSGCLRGMQCGRSASSVGLATTSAVVTAIVFIVIAAAVLTVVYNALGF
ncbi:MAG: ABC transporter permease [Gammaproteobacteria bacterium]|jgi:phospholipid/cholesterol/gamma-HCH transport system permease protein|nr:ABC transporter permease [Gammaproteobacteria bacterium]